MSDADPSIPRRAVQGGMFLDIKAGVEVRLEAVRRSSSPPKQKTILQGGDACRPGIL